MKKRVLIVGAGGFAGGFIAEEGLRRGYEVWAGVRRTTDRRYLSDPRLHFIELDFDTHGALSDALRNALPDGEKWDYIIYNLGATKVMRYSDFSRINHDYLRAFTGALQQLDLVPEKLLYMSSLSALGPYGERDRRPATEDMIPQPNTRYGASKLKAEIWLATSGIPYIIFRATGIYGPRDHDYFLEFKSLKSGFDFQVGFRSQALTFIYVEDLARAVYDALENAPTGETYNISENRAYSQKEFRKIVKKELGKKFVLPVKLPLFMVKMACWVSEKWAVARLKTSTLNSDKYKILRQRNWRVNTDKARSDFGFEAIVPLNEGVHRSIEWYKENGWL